MKKIWQVIKEHIPLIISAFAIWFIVDFMFTRVTLKATEAKVKTEINPYLDSIYDRGFELGKLSMAYGIVRVMDSTGVLRPRPWNLKRAGQIADSVKNAK